MWKVIFLSLSLMVRLFHGMEMEWNGIALGMGMRFQCLLDKNKWKWECAEMSLMCLLGKINENKK